MPIDFASPSEFNRKCLRPKDSVRTPRSVAIMTTSAKVSKPTLRTPEGAVDYNLLL